MAQLHIKRAVERVPGGMMIVPLLIGSLIATFMPGMPKFFGSFTNALFTGALPILAVFYVCMGASIDVKATPCLLKKGGALFVTKVGTAIIAGIVLGHFLGEQPISSGLFAGISTLAVVAAMNDTNGGLYMALMGQYGRSEDGRVHDHVARIGPVPDDGHARRRRFVRVSVADARRQHSAARGRHAARQSRSRDARVSRPRRPGDDSVLRAGARREPRSAQGLASRFARHRTGFRGRHRDGHSALFRGSSDGRHGRGGRGGSEHRGQRGGRSGADRGGESGVQRGGQVGDAARRGVRRRDGDRVADIDRIHRETRERSARCGFVREGSGATQ